MARYTVSYTSGPTGYGWEQDVNSFAEVKRMVKSCSVYTSMVTVWDSKKSDFIYWKRCLRYMPDTDLLNIGRVSG